MGHDAALQTDVTQLEQVMRLVDDAVQTCGRSDVMIDNAGLMPHSPLERLEIDEWTRMIDVNIEGVLYGIAAARSGAHDLREGPSRADRLFDGDSSDAPADQRYAVALADLAPALRDQDDETATGHETT